MPGGRGDNNGPDKKRPRFVRPGIGFLSRRASMGSPLPVRARLQRPRVRAQTRRAAALILTLSSGGRMATIALDFDGVLFPSHQYTRRDEIIGPPQPGATTFVRRCLDRGHEIFILTSRLADCPPYAEQRFHRTLRAWLAEYFGSEAAAFIKATAIKHPADIYLDDKACRFAGDWLPVESLPSGGFRGCVDSYDAQIAGAVAPPAGE